MRCKEAAASQKIQSAHHTAGPSWEVAAAFFHLHIAIYLSGFELEFYQHHNPSTLPLKTATLEPL
jgi:hypothetical protein